MKYFVTAVPLAFELFHLLPMTRNHYADYTGGITVLYSMFLIEYGVSKISFLRDWVVDCPEYIVN